MPDNIFGEYRNFKKLPICSRNLPFTSVSQQNFSEGFPNHALSSPPFLFWYFPISGDLSFLKRQMHFVQRMSKRNTQFDLFKSLDLTFVRLADKFWAFYWFTGGGHYYLLVKIEEDTE